MYDKAAFVENHLKDKKEREVLKPLFTCEIVKKQTPFGYTFVGKDLVVDPNTKGLYKELLKNIQISSDLFELSFQTSEYGHHDEMFSFTLDTGEDENENYDLEVEASEQEMRPQKSRYKTLLRS